MMQLAALVKNYDFFLSADEVNMKFTYDGDVHYSVFGTFRIRKCDHVDSVSKKYERMVQGGYIIQTKS
jgi:aspartate/methionine/tyrosine aminotransferase